MASPEIVQEQFDRLIAHSERWLTEEEYDRLLVDWESTLRHLPDWAVMDAGDEMMMLGKMPSLNVLLACAQRHARDRVPDAFRPPPMPETHPEPGDYAHVVIDATRRFLADRKTAPSFPHAPEPLNAPFTCSCGEMRGWVERAAVPLTVRPCERCRPDQYQRWREEVTGMKSL